MAKDVHSIDAQAERLRDAYRGAPIAPLRNVLGADDIAAAYAVQDANTRFWTAQGRSVAGCKIGLTSAAVQAQLGVDQPDYGMLFDDMRLADGTTVPVTVLQPRIEAEMALILARDLDDPVLDRAALVAATDHVVAALEIVGSRITGWDIGIVDTVADNASSGAYVLGTQRVKADAIDLELAGMVMTRSGTTVSLGVGAACLGHPLDAALWLARRMAELGRPLRGGWTILTGALGPMVAVAPGDRFEARIAGLGSVAIQFEGDSVQ